MTSSTPTKTLWVAAAAFGLLAVTPTLGFSEKQHDPNQYMVQFHEGKAEHGKAAVRAAGAKVVLDLGPQNAVAAHIPPHALNGLSRNPNIESIEVDGLRVPMAQTTPYGIGMVEADQVSAANAANRKVCIIDSGYSLQHEDLADSGVTGTNDSGTGNWYVDNSGHGTHVAGTIAAMNNAVGVVGVVPGVKLHIIKVFGDDGSWTYSSSLVSALNKCRDAGANVVSMSLGGSLKNGVEDRAFASAYNAGVLSIAAAGNDGNNRTSYPAGYASVVSVAAVDSNKNKASFSQYNKDVELAAPGVGVLSTIPWIGTHSLTAGGTTWTGGGMEGSASSSGTSGILANGGLCDTNGNGAWAAKVVLCQRGTVTFADKVNNVQSGGGVAAVIYNNVAGGFSGTLNGTSAIPAIGLSDTDGAAALTQVGQSGTVVNLVTKPASGYDAWDGTSMATPHVSGVAALVWSCNPAWTNKQIRTALIATAEDLGVAGRDVNYGYGLVRARAARDYLLGPTGNCTP